MGETVWICECGEPIEGGAHLMEHRAFAHEGKPFKIKAANLLELREARR